MASQMSALLRRLEGHLRSGYNQRASLTKASPEAWTTCSDCLGAAYTALDDIFPAERGGQASSTAFWVHWRKSSASNQLLALMKAIGEAVASEADWMPAESGVGSLSSVGELRNRMAVTWGLAADCLVGRLLLGSNQGVLWPALREWLFDCANLKVLWGGTAWLLSLPMDSLLHATRALSVGEAPLTCTMLRVLELISTTLSFRLMSPTSAILQQPSVEEALRLTFVKLLPSAFTAVDIHAYDRFSVMFIGIVANLGNEEPQLIQPLHRLSLGAWPRLVGALRRRQGDPASGLKVL